MAIASVTRVAAAPAAAWRPGQQHLRLHRTSGRRRLFGDDQLLPDIAMAMTARWRMPGGLV
jgi:hypothetical protein